MQRRHLLIAGATLAAPTVYAQTPAAVPQYAGRVLMTAVEKALA
jgi:hypothetical protein